MRLRAILAALSAGALCVAGVVPATAAPPLDWRPCAQDSSVDCAELTVRIDPASASDGTTTLRLTRTKADPAQRVGVLVVPPSTSASALSARLRTAFDVVTYSERVLTPVDTSASCKTPTTVAASPRNAQEFTHLRAANLTAFTGCARRYGVAWQHLDSATEAHDVDAVRTALGEDRISFLSTATGEIVGQEYLRLFGQRLRALVLDGPTRRDLATAAEYSAAHARAAEKAFGAFADWCATASTCAARTFDLRSFYAETIGKIERGEFRDLRGNPLELTDWASVVEMSLATPRFGWLDLAQHLREMHDRSLPVDTRAEAVAREASPDFTAQAVEPAPGLCQDWNLPITTYAQVGEIRSAMVAAAPLTHVNGQRWSAVLRCVGWPFPAANPPTPTRGTAPVLVASTAFNPAAPPGSAEVVAAGIPGATTVSYHGPGTSAYQFSSCARTAIDDFLITGRAAADAGCPAVWP
ncbi:alpha/beta hydrolase [Umezawaea sp. NPDC059074]|uniref:alpha/beta hydrolase n=1 Tax=Umezawaea sp. NPDC059074 TaxID=3346716 RepID=UPI003673BCBE